MYSINNNVDNTIIIKKSKFITKLYKINNIDQINNILNKLKQEYKDATHICYAYIIEGNIKCSDDGEPSGTAGLPMLNILKKNNLNYILAIVIRYFGGIKLGAGGLIRAYSNSISDALKLVKIIELQEGLNITIIFNYNNIKYIDILFNNEVVNKKYDNNVEYNINILKDKYESIKDNLIKNCININIVKFIYIRE